MRDARTIIAATAKHGGYKPAELVGRGQGVGVSRVRHRAIFLTRRLLGIGYSATGRRFKRDHSTIIHAVARVERRLIDDAEERAAIEAVLQLLGVDEMPLRSARPDNIDGAALPRFLRRRQLLSLIATTAAQLERLYGDLAALDREDAECAA